MTADTPGISMADLHARTLQQLEEVTRRLETESDERERTWLDAHRANLSMIATLAASVQTMGAAVGRVAVGGPSALPTRKRIIRDPDTGLIDTIIG
jgi:hypothetical protein